jgi:endonuclease YncB( thermonuclease family)
MKCRLLGIDGAELRTRDLDEKRIAELGRDFVKETILGKVIKVQCGHWDKYGRLLVVIYHNTKSKKSLNDILIEKKFAYSYDGKKKKHLVNKK